VNERDESERPVTVEHGDRAGVDVTPR
jgi:hypothetical protein